MCDVQKNKTLKEILKSLDIWFVTLFSQTKKAPSQKKFNKILAHGVECNEDRIY